MCEIQNSPEAIPYSPFTPVAKPELYIIVLDSDVLGHLARSLLLENLNITVRRKQLLPDALRKGQKTKFTAIKVRPLYVKCCVNNAANLPVSFAGESAVDMGGPK